MRIVATVIVLLGALAGTAAAEEPVVGSLPSVFRYPTPPPEFRPLTASDEDLARFGLPPRPKPGAHPSVPYAAWSKAMSAARFPIEPQIVRTGRRHIRAIVVTATKTHQTGAMASTNWAGQALINPVGSFGAGSYAEVLAQWQIPAVQQAIGTCSGTDVSSIWIGIDGSSRTGGSTDVMQAGTEADARCYEGASYPSYYAWFEWYPGDEYEVTNFPISPGQSVLVVVRATSTTTASVTFVGLASNTYTTVGFSAPAGTTLRGDSAEWVVERPTVNNVLGKLADYGLAWISSEVAFLDDELDTGTYDVAGTGGPGRTPYTLTMVDNNGDPLSESLPQGPTAQVLNVTGSAY